MLVAGVVDTLFLALGAMVFMVGVAQGRGRVAEASDALAEEQRMADVIQRGITRQLVLATGVLAGSSESAEVEAARSRFLEVGEAVQVGIRRFLFGDLSPEERIELERMREEHQLFEVAAVQSMELVRRGVQAGSGDVLEGMTGHANEFLGSVDRLIRMRERDLAAFREGQEQAFRRLWVGAGIFALLVTVTSLGLSWSLYRRVTRPLHAVTAAAERMGAGDLTARAPEAGHQELAALSEAFNHMADRLQVAAQALEVRNQELEEALAHAEKTRTELVQLEKLGAIGRMTAGFAHEINNPLTSVLGYSQLLQQRLEGRHEVEVAEVRNLFLDPVLHEASRARQLVRHLLEVSRPPQGEPIPVDLGKVLGTVRMLHAYVFQQAGLELVVDEVSDIYVLAEPQTLEGMILNLVTNAKDALSPRGKGRLKVSARTSGLFVDLVFEDDGPGLPDTERIFEPFYTTKPVGEGTGLGLAMVQRVATAYGGRVQAENVTTGGARFTLTLPRPTSPVPSDRGTAEVQQEAGPRPAGRSARDDRPLKVLVVDDEPHLRRLQERILHTIDAEVLLAGSVAEARDILHRETVDVVVSDVRMPGESGFDLYRWTEQQNLPVARSFLFVTGDAGDPEVLQIARNRPDRVVQKPFEIQEYLSLVTAIAADPCPADS